MIVLDEQLLVPFQGGFDKCHSERPQGAKNLHLRSSRFLLRKWRFFASAPLRCAPAQNDRIRHFDLEKVLGRGIEEEIAKWYRGAVRFITDLRPNTVIKDKAIPQLLRQQNRPTFVTIKKTGPISEIGPVSGRVFLE